nr:callose synthase 5 [Tanacetum cinerariifolium]
MLEGYKAVNIPRAEDKKSQSSLYAQLEAIVDMKFTYVATCQEYEREGGKSHKVFYYVLVKAIDNHDQEIHRTRLPGFAKIGEGKPENQNHAIIFTRGEALW